MRKVNQQQETCEAVILTISATSLVNKYQKVLSESANIPSVNLKDALPRLEVKYDGEAFILYGDNLTLHRVYYTIVRSPYSLNATTGKHYHLLLFLAAKMKQQN